MFHLLQACARDRLYHQSHHRTTHFGEQNVSDAQCDKEVLGPLTHLIPRPARRIAELVPAQSPAQPTFKIMRRSLVDRQRPKPHSQAGSVAGEDAELSDPEPSEAGSLGGRSNATGGSKKHKTIAEREAAYNEARSRIFMDFNEKERKEKDLSASSSTVSLTSGSVTSAGETSSMGDMDDSVSSPTTESEWSGPVVRDKKDSHRSNGSSSRNLRSTAPGPSFNGSNSSRGSRAPSPSSFKYPTLYEPSPVAVPYDLLQAPVQAPGYGNPYMYAYPQPAPPAPNYIPPYHYYATYPYPHPQTPLQNADPGNPSHQADVYPSQQPPQHQGFMFLIHGIRQLLLTPLLSTDPSPPLALPSLHLLHNILLTRHPSHPMDPTRCLIIHPLLCIPCNHPLQFRTKYITLLNTMVHTTHMLLADRTPGLSVNSLQRWAPSPEVLHLLEVRGVTVLG
jgi:hypothetical protein